MRSTEHPATLEEKLSVIGLSIREVPPSGEGDRYDGFIEVAGKAETAVEFLKAVAEANGCYGEGYRLLNIKRNLEKFDRQRHQTIDVDVKNPQGEVRMLRVQTNGRGQDGNLELSFGGGGNRTTFAEMQYALDKAVDKMRA